MALTIKDIAADLNAEAKLATYGGAAPPVPTTPRATSGAASFAQNLEDVDWGGSSDDMTLAFLKLNVLSDNDPAKRTGSFVTRV